MKQLLVLTDGEENILGIVRINVVDAVNRPSLKKGIEILQHSERNAWISVQNMENDEGRESEPKSTGKKGYVILMDKKVVVFYKNYLAETSRQDVEGSCDFKI